MYIFNQNNRTIIITFNPWCWFIDEYSYYKVILIFINKKTLIYYPQVKLNTKLMIDDYDIP